MPALQTVLGDLNHAFGRERIADLVSRRDRFAPGQPLGAGLVVREGTPLYEAWQSYIGHLPGSFQNTIQGIIHYALGTAPATHITFAWAPGYDYELTIWHAPDTKLTRGGITVLIKSRYPGDKNPLWGDAD